MPQSDNGARQERFLGIGITGVVVQQGDKALKKLRQYDTTKMSPTRRDELERLMETSRWKMINEMKIYKHLGYHDGILKAFFNDDVDFATPFETVILMPFMKNGDLQQYLSRNEPEEYRQVRWILSLASALAFCYTKNVIVADINSRNCLLTDDMSLKLCDFGESTIIQPHLNIAKVNVDGVSV